MARPLHRVCRAVRDPIFTQEAKIDLVDEVLYIEEGAVVAALVLSFLALLFYNLRIT